MNENQNLAQTPATNEQSEQSYEIKSDFYQHLDNNDLINYNCYLIEKRAKSSIFSKILGVFIIFLGIYAFFNVPEGGLKTSDIVKNCIFIVIGIIFVFVLNPLTIRMQRSIIRKKITGNYPEVIMNVVVSNEGISFSVPSDDDTNVSRENIEPEESSQKEQSNEQAREEEQEQEELLTEDSPEGLEEEAIDETKKPVKWIDTLPTEDPEMELCEDENSDETDEQAKEEKFTIPWGGIVNIEDDGAYMFVNMVGFQSMLIKKEDCPNLDEVKTYILEKLNNPKQYIEKKKK